MSTQCNTYVMIGAVLPYGPFQGKSDELDPWRDSAFKGIEHRNGITVLYDGMNGEYVAVGKVLAKTENWRGFEDPVPLAGDLTIKELIEFGKVLAQAEGEVPDFQIAPFVISHYR